MTAARINVYPGVFARKFDPRWMALDHAAVRRAMVDGLGRYFRSARKKRAVVGLSGGLDSAVAAQIAAETLGRRNVTGVAMPYLREELRYREQKDWQDAKMVARHIGIGFDTREITDEADSLVRQLGINPDSTRLSAAQLNLFGNIQARMRMLLLYARAEAIGSALVVGTGNRSELIVGYATKHGDAADDINPLGEIYKTQEFDFARFLGLPQRIIDRVPTAGLFEGQTDEGQLGFRYSELDPFSFLYFDRNYSIEKIRTYGFTLGFARRVLKLYRTNMHKTNRPPIVELNYPRQGTGEYLERA